MAKYFPPLEKRGKTDIIDKKAGSRGREYISPHDKIPRNEEHYNMNCPLLTTIFIMEQNMAKWWCDECVLKEHINNT